MLHPIARRKIYPTTPFRTVDAAIYDDGPEAADSDASVRTRRGATRRVSNPFQHVRRGRSVTDTYGLVVHLESYEFDGEFYLVGKGCETPGDVLVDVASEHIRAFERRRPLHEYLLDVLRTGEAVSRSEYDAVDPDIECRLHIDVYYGWYWFETGDEQLELPIQPTPAAIEQVADRLDS